MKSSCNNFICIISEFRAGDNSHPGITSLSILGFNYFQIVIFTLIKRLLCWQCGRTLKRFLKTSAQSWSCRQENVKPSLSGSSAAWRACNNVRFTNKLINVTHKFIGSHRSWFMLLFAVFIVSSVSPSFLLSLYQDFTWASFNSIDIPTGCVCIPTTTVNTCSTIFWAAST